MLSDCKSNRGGIVSLAVTSPSGVTSEAEKDALKALVEGSDTRVTYSPFTKLLSRTCKLRGRCKTCREFDLSESLLQAGLAALPKKVSRLNPNNAWDAAESRAKQSQRGIWWDWDEAPTQDIDPIVWRGERDATLANAESSQAGRAQALLSAMSGALTLSAGLLTGYFFSKLEKLSAEAKLRSTVLQDLRDASFTTMQGVEHFGTAIANDLGSEVFTKYKDTLKSANLLRSTIDKNAGQFPTLTPFRLLMLSIESLFDRLSQAVERLENRKLDDDTRDELKSMFTNGIGEVRKKMTIISGLTTK